MKRQNHALEKSLQTSVAVHLTSAELAQHHDGTWGDELTRTRVTAHLRRCLICQRRLQFLQEVTAEAAAIAPVDVPPIYYEIAQRILHAETRLQDDEEIEELTLLLAASEGHGIAAGEHPPEQLTLDPIGTFEVEGIRYEALADAEGNVFLQPAPDPGKTHLVLDDIPYGLNRAEDDKGLCPVIGLGRGQLELFFALRSIEEDQHDIGFKE